MDYLNYTPHKINLNDGRHFASIGLARVSSSFTEIVGDECQQVFGKVEGLPVQQEGVKIIVSAMVLAASNRSDLVAPATGHPLTKRNDKGHIISVPCFISK
jgi:hypothetical protein